MSVDLKNLRHETEPYVMFVDMNSFFARCEQQVNYYLRGRPVGVCVYTGKNGCVISPSTEAKQKGVKTGMRLPEAMKLCPGLIPVETHPDRYREFHVKIMDLLRRYHPGVIPRSIDEAVLNLHHYKLVYKDPEALARRIKQDIRDEVGEWLTCSIGLAPNVLLAKLASDLQNPDGLVMITPQNIDHVLQGLRLEDLPGIASGMAGRLRKSGFFTPLDLRYARPRDLQVACQSIVGLYWHYRLNFAEVDMDVSDYKSMQAMRQLSPQQRKSVRTVRDILMTLCMTLEKRMVRKAFHCRSVYFWVEHDHHRSLKWKTEPERPVQDGMTLLKIINDLIQKQEAADPGMSVLDTSVTTLGVGVSHFMDSEMLEYTLFEETVMRKDRLRKTVYDLKEKFGRDKILKGAQMHENIVAKDVIGFGSIKDFWPRNS